MYLAVAVLALGTVLSWVTPVGGILWLVALNVATLPAALNEVRAHQPTVVNSKPARLARTFWVCLAWASAVTVLVGMTVAVTASVAGVLLWLLLLFVSAVPPLALLFLEAHRPSANA
ncbi:hypothetical protein QN367_08475 [Cryobacterium sp. RTS3]|uniref:hypothetical protein n=1 Tax=Cryobacterium sp. RTS3 TaxID=3048643 RepID=UPI002B236D74|nr:hypothetical protein [Cryobacterium sp. RTS3]MEA9999132.1 hypothetical protein [Cryobacterium sp. RTS3]